MSIKETMKRKAVEIACNPKVYNAVCKVQKGAVAASAAVGAVGMTMVNASAETGTTATVSTILTTVAAADKITAGYAPFLEPAIIILCAVSGVRLGMKLLKGAAK
ncbi:MAG: hypothetical protein IJ368_03125 [Oscillospiraceae bacterium]|nr:hypothetical protein [Oscillospiraceae bacterium]